ncbi:MAG: MBL fold metallo-hydrolase [SAR202 cluster bacterium]|nr:MBL fold metallo-hydrolase [SAR202 cluster bacterium]
MSDNPIYIGNVEVIPVSDGWMKFRPGNFFPTVPHDAWNRYEETMPEGKLVFNSGCYVLRSQGKVILVDTGVGKGSTDLWEASAGKLLTALSDNGVDPDEVDMVLLTHLHRDHVGWNIIWDGDRFRPTFTKARYWMPKIDFDVYSTKADLHLFSYLEKQVLPLKDIGVVDFISGEQHFTNEVSSLPTPGHTPGHTSFVISSKGERGIITGDVLHHPAQIDHPEWSPRGDEKQVEARETRANIVQQLVLEGAIALVGHFPGPGIGRVVRRDSRLTWQPL